MALAGSMQRVDTRAEQRASVYGHEQLPRRDTEWRGVLRNPLYNDLRLLCEDIARHGRVLPDTWRYFEAQRLSLVAESLRTQHQKTVEGVYVPERDVVVAGRAGGEDITLEDITATGLARVQAAAALDPRLAFQVCRDEVYATTYRQHLKPLLAEGANHDIVVYMSSCPVDLDVPEGQDADNLRALAKDLFYDLDEKTWYLYIAQATRDGGRQMLNTHSIRMAGSDDQLIRQRLVEYGYDEHEVQAASLHELGRFVGRICSNGLPVQDFIDAEVAWFDRMLEAKTGEAVTYGRPDTTVEAYQLFEGHPEINEANRTYHEMLARHVVGDALDPRLRTYLLSSLHAQEVALKTRAVDNTPVISMQNIYNLRRSIERGRIDLSVIGPCQDLMMYAHGALFQSMLEKFAQTGEFVDIVERGDLLGSYGDAASALGGEATFVGREGVNCPGTVGTSSQPQSAAELAASLGISLEEATRRLGKMARVANNASLAEKYGAHNVFYNRECGACGNRTAVGPCGPGFCNDCDTADRNDPGYILRLYTRRQAQLAKEAAVDTSPSRAQAEAVVVESNHFKIDGEAFMYRDVVGIGGSKQVLVRLRDGQIMAEL